MLKPVLVVLDNLTVNSTVIKKIQDITDDKPYQKVDWLLSSVYMA